MSISAEKLGALLSAAWRRYVDAFGEPPHGTTKQMAALCALMPAEPPAPLPDGEAVAWRWRYRNFPGEMGWIVVASKPKDHDDVDIQPLYTSLPASKIKIIPGGPPCSTCGFRLVQREQSPFVADDE